MQHPNARYNTSWLRGVARLDLVPIELTGEALSSLVELAEAVGQIRARLESEGFQFLDGIIVAPNTDV